ncbi:MAG: ferritin-like domain-containing protein [Flavobacterium sp.]|uniref:YciE/YciF ferroxidase family protein n=1 Tax=Flavobacterium sp. TaxID=239 RepID=UPI003266069F
MKTATTTKKPSAKSTVAKATSPTAKGKVKPKRTAAEGLRDLFIDELKDIYWAEKALVKALPKMAKNVTTPHLATSIVNHLHETENHVTRLEEVFSLMGEKAVAKKCDAMDGLLKEGESILEDTEPGAVRDAGIILAAQKVEHYEIATYGTLVAFAGTLGEVRVAELLKETLDEEKNADAILTYSAYHNINFEAELADEE